MAKAENYRFGYNGQEKVDEISGAGNHNTAEFWEYETQLGRRWNLDPKPNPSISPLSVFANNPIWYNDVNGDTLRGETERDADATLHEMKNVFGENSALFNNYFTIGSDGKTFEKVTDVRDFNQWLNGTGAHKGQGSGFSREQIALANGFMKEINSGFKLTISFSPGNDQLRSIDTHSAIAYIGEGAGTGNFCDTKGNLREYTRTQTFVHEVLGEGYTSMMSGNMQTYTDIAAIPPSLRTKSQMQTLHSGDLIVIQIENTYNRIFGFERAGIQGEPGGHNLTYKDLPKVGLTPPNLGASYYRKGDYIWPSK